MTYDAHPITSQPQPVLSPLHCRNFARPFITAQILLSKLPTMVNVSLCLISVFVELY
jgi:hypothetical protein